MDAQPRELRLFQTPNGDVPFLDWLKQLRDGAGRARIRTRLDRLSQGNVGDCKAVGEGVLELKIHFGPDYRVYFAQEGSTVVLLLLGGDKSTQATDIARAKVYWKEHQGRTT